MRLVFRQRLVVIIVLLALLIGLFVLFGTTEPNPDDNNFPETEDITRNPGQYIGERVNVDGIVVETAPLTIEDEPKPGEQVTFLIHNTDQDVAIGDRVNVFGTLQPDNHIRAESTTHREPWEAQYMYIVSFLAGLSVLTRLFNQWTVDTSNWTIVPRNDSLIELL